MLGDRCQQRGREPDDRFVRSDVARLAAAVAPVTEIESLLRQRYDRRVGAHGLEHGRGALDAFAAGGVQVREDHPHQLLGLVLEHDDVGHVFRAIEGKEVEEPHAAGRQLRHRLEDAATHRRIGDDPEANQPFSGGSCAGSGRKRPEAEGCSSGRAGKAFRIQGDVGSPARLHDCLAVAVVLECSRSGWGIRTRCEQAHAHR